MCFSFGLLLTHLTLSSFFNRCLATSAKLNEAAAANPAPKEKLNKAVAPNQSFVANFFRGKVESAEVFPYPYNLSEEESETLGMVVDPVERFFSVSLIT